MSRARGLVLQNALARYLSAWWPSAESAGAGRNGTDVLGTPGIAWECKTAVEFKRDFRPVEWVKQAQRHAIHECDCTQPQPCSHQADLPVTVYFPAGVGEARAGAALVILPMDRLIYLLYDAGYMSREKEAS